MFSRARILNGVKVVLHRTYKPESMTDETRKSLIALQSHALTKPGYLSSEVLHNIENTHDQLLITRWESVPSWVEFRDDPIRLALHKKIQPHLANPEILKVYIGTSAITSEKSLADRVAQIRGGSIGNSFTDIRKEDKL